MSEKRPISIEVRIWAVDVGLGNAVQSRRRSVGNEVHFHAGDGVFVSRKALHAEETLSVNASVSPDKVLQLSRMFSGDWDLSVEPVRRDQGSEQRAKLVPMREMEKAFVEERPVGLV